MARLVLLLILLLAALPAGAVGFQQAEVPDPADRPIEVGIWYPSDAPASPQMLWPYRQVVAPGGALIYETFARGNERYGKPSRPEFLLADNELISAFAPSLRVVAYEHRAVDAPKPALVQRIACVRET